MLLDPELIKAGSEQGLWVRLVYQHKATRFRSHLYRLIQSYAQQHSNCTFGSFEPNPTLNCFSKAAPTGSGSSAYKGSQRVSTTIHCLQPISRDKVLFLSSPLDWEFYSHFILHFEHEIWIPGRVTTDNTSATELEPTLRNAWAGPGTWATRRPSRSWPGTSWTAAPGSARTKLSVMFLRV